MTRACLSIGANNAARSDLYERYVPGIGSPSGQIPAEFCGLDLFLLAGWGLAPFNPPLGISQ
jgi:hypothetical protein